MCFICVCAITQYKLWFTIFYYSLDALLNTIWIVWTVFLSYVCSDSYLHVFVDRGLAFWGIIFSCSIWRSCSSLGEWSGFSCEDWRIVQLYKTIQLYNYRNAHRTLNWIHVQNLKLFIKGSFNFHSASRVRWLAPMDGQKNQFMDGTLIN